MRFVCCSCGSACDRERLEVSGEVDPFAALHPDFVCVLVDDVDAGDGGARAFINPLLALTAPPAEVKESGSLDAVAFAVLFGHALAPDRVPMPVCAASFASDPSAASHLADVLRSERQQHVVGFLHLRGRRCWCCWPLALGCCQLPIDAVSRSFNVTSNMLLGSVR
jgi:hypothetical protein